VDRSWLGKRVSSCAWMSHAKFMRASVPELRLIHRPISDEYAVFSTLAEIVMNGVRRARLQAGEAVVVYGLGLLGQLAVRFCRLCGARPVFGVDISAFRRRLLPRDPAVRGIDPQAEDVAAAVKAATGGYLADAVFEVTGVAELIPAEFSALREQGRFIVLSSPRGKTAFDFHDLCNRPSYTIIGAHNMSHPRQESADNPWTPARNAALFFDWIADGEIDLKPLITHRQAGVRAPEIYQRLMQDRGQAMGVVLRW
ncbi:MAG: zinc-binding alcohol dehydrogenase, partial [Planctomycetota bacterium]|nr:zinc-binding alcohol dehydrogenase [Planctomycetota bacterium]